MPYHNNLSTWEENCEDHYRTYGLLDAHLSETNVIARAEGQDEMSEED